MAKFGKKFKLAAVKTLRFAHKITHKGPIGKIHDKIAKAIPAPFNVFVKIGTATNDTVHKLMVKAKILKPEDIAKHGKKPAATIRDEARKAIVKGAQAGNPAAQKAMSAMKMLDTVQTGDKDYRVVVDGEVFNVRRGG